MIHKSIIFTFFIPGTVVGGIPVLLYYFLRIYLRLDGFRYIGIIFINIGAIFYLCSVASFIIQGRGTPMIYFMEKTDKLFGKEPIALVTSTLYKFSRNPMYLGVIVATFGIGNLLESQYILIWSLLSFIIFHFVIIKLEEPHLREKFGMVYVQYCKNTPRWIGFRKIKRQKI